MLNITSNTDVRQVHLQYIGVCFPEARGKFDLLVRDMLTACISYPIAVCGCHVNVVKGMCVSHVWPLATYRPIYHFKQGFGVS